jgi:replicative DNA helicase
MSDDLTLPPHDLDAERAVLGSLILDRDAIAVAAPIVSRRDFYNQAHGVIFQAIQTLFQRREPADLITLPAELNRLNALERCGGIGYLADLMTAVPTALYVDHYATHVAEKATKRRLIEAGQTIVRLGYDGLVTGDDAIGQARAAVASVANATSGLTGKTYAEAAETLVTEMQSGWENPHGRNGDLVKTGFHALDRALNGAGGFERGQLVIVGARPSMGKSAFMLQMAHNFARLENSTNPDPRWTLIFSSEMTLRALLFRALAEVSGVTVSELKTGYHLSPADKAKVIAHARYMGQLPIWIDDSSRPTTAQMQQRVERFSIDRPVRMVMFDYIEQAGNSGGRDGNEEKRISKISSDLKHIAKTTETTVIALSQLNRDVERRENKRPKLADLRQSGMIEQDADIVMFLYRDQYYSDRGDMPEDATKAGQCDVILAKQREGEIGTFTLGFEPSLTAFRELSA